jgi:hypothetical protein
MTTAHRLAGIPASPYRPATRCHHCGETIERQAEDGESVLLIGKAQRFNLAKGTVAWQCKGCGATNTLHLFAAAVSPIKKAGIYRPGESAHYDPHMTVEKRHDT